MLPASNTPSSSSSMDFLLPCLQDNEVRLLPRCDYSTTESSFPPLPQGKQRHQDRFFSRLNDTCGIFYQASRCSREQDSSVASFSSSSQKSHVFFPSSLSIQQKNFPMHFAISYAPFSPLLREVERVFFSHPPLAQQSWFFSFALRSTPQNSRPTPSLFFLSSNKNLSLF